MDDFKLFLDVFQYPIDSLYHTVNTEISLSC